MGSETEVERNAAVCAEFGKGKTQAQVAAEFGVSRQRVGQIWRAAGLKRAPAGKKEYLGAFVSPEAKEIARIVSLRRNTSVSAIVDALLVELGAKESLIGSAEVSQ